MMNEIAKREPTYSERFTNAVIREFATQVGTLQLSPYQEKLAQHMFVAIDAQLKSLEAKRKDQNKPAITWQNINMAKLAIDAVHRVELGLDALIPNHIHPIPYLNSHTGKYDLDLRIGYVGKDYYRRKMAVEEPVNIIYELVYETDKFRPIKGRAGESYEFEITNPFDRGKVVGGFGYIQYADETKNKLILVSKADFDKSKQRAQSNDFWGQWEERMQFKTLVHRTTSHLSTDPMKVNASFLNVELEDAINEVEREIEQSADKEILDIEPETPPESASWICNMCGFEAKSEQGLKKHMTQSHQKQQPSEDVVELRDTVTLNGYLSCPQAIDSRRPRKSIEICHQCDSRIQCDSYADYMSSENPQAGDQEKLSLEPEF